MKNLNVSVIYAMKAKSMTGVALARRAGVSVRVVSQLINGRLRPGVMTAVKIGGVLNLPVSKIRGESSRDAGREKFVDSWRRIVGAGGTPPGIACLVMRLAGLSYDEIGQMFHPHITRQAIEKHLRKAHSLIPGLSWRGPLLHEAQQHTQVDNETNGDETIEAQAASVRH